jgi:hypothetical protein
VTEDQPYAPVITTAKIAVILGRSSKYRSIPDTASSTLIQVADLALFDAYLQHPSAPLKRLWITVHNDPGKGHRLTTYWTHGNNGLNDSFEIANPAIAARIEALLDRACITITENNASQRDYLVRLQADDIVASHHQMAQLLNSIDTSDAHPSPAK